MKSEVGRMLIKQSCGDYLINESPKVEILPTSDSNTQDFTDENIIFSTPVDLNLSENTQYCTEENVLISPQVDLNLSANTHNYTDEYIPPIDTKLLNQFDIWMREKKTSDENID